MPLHIRRIDSLDDPRGLSLPVGDSLNDVFAAARDCHVTSILPGEHRGNHAHERKHETLVVVFHDRWTLHWDDGVGTERRREPFEGAGLVVVTVPPGAAHAISNEGAEKLVVIGISDQPWDPDSPDAVPRGVI